MKRSGELSPWGQEIRIACCAIPFLGPEFEEESTFQNKRVPVFRFAQAEEHSFEAILREYESEIIIPLLRKIEQSLSDGGGKVFDLRVRQLE
jgi:hypothetical protein